MSTVNKLAHKYGVTSSYYSSLIKTHSLVLSSQEDLFAEEADAGLKENIKELFKRAILPAVLLVGPVACGPGGQQHDERSEQKAEQVVNKELDKQGISCDIKKTNKGQQWVFKDKKAKDGFILSFDAESEDGIIITDYSEPMIDAGARTPRMKNVQNSLIDYFSEQGGEMGKKMLDISKGYSCEKESQKGPVTTPKL